MGNDMSEKTEQNAETITIVLASMEDGLSLRKACDLAEVSVTVFLRWVDADKELQEQYARTRARLLDVKAEELEEIGERAASAETTVEVAGLRLLSDNRKWLLSKLAPKKYGDKIQTEHSGSIGLTKQLSDAELEAIAAGSGG